jgi:hypothetical protein
MTETGRQLSKTSVHLDRSSSGPQLSFKEAWETTKKLADGAYFSLRPEISCGVGIYHDRVVTTCKIYISKKGSCIVSGPTWESAIISLIQILRPHVTMDELHEILPQQIWETAIACLRKQRYPVSTIEDTAHIMPTKSMEI